MKRILVALAAALFLVSFTVGVALAGNVKMTGKVMAIDTAKGEMSFCPNGSKEQKVMKVDADMIKTKKIEKGNVVDLYVEKADSNVVKKIHKSATVPVGC